MDENQENNKVTDTSLEIEKMKKELQEIKESNDTQLQDIDKQLNHLNHKRKKDKVKVKELQEEIGKDHKQSAVVRSESQKPITTTSTLEDNKSDAKDSKDSTKKDKKGKDKKPEGEKIDNLEIQTFCHFFGEVF